MGPRFKLRTSQTLSWCKDHQTMALPVKLIKFNSIRKWNVLYVCWREIRVLKHCFQANFWNCPLKFWTNFLPTYFCEQKNLLRNHFLISSPQLAWRHFWKSPRCLTYFQEKIFLGQTSRGQATIQGRGECTRLVPWQLTLQVFCSPWWFDPFRPSGQRARESAKKFKIQQDHFRPVLRLL